MYYESKGSSSVLKFHFDLYQCMLFKSHISLFFHMQTLFFKLQISLFFKRQISLFFKLQIS